MLNIVKILPIIFLTVINCLQPQLLEGAPTKRASKKFKKIVGLVPARNEENIIGQCLQALSLYTDAIIFLDDASDDNTLSIVESLKESCKVEKIIKKKEWYRDEPGDRNMLLDEGRKIGGTHFIVIDADEMFTSNFLISSYLRKLILKLKPGDKLLLNWIQLWRSVDKFRFDKSVWTDNYKAFIFCDEKKARYESEFIHTSRVPGYLTGKVYKVEGNKYGLLHFQFVDWTNLLVKQAWYRCLERIRLPQKSCAEINERYGHSKDETDINLNNSNPDWFVNYTFFDPSVYHLPVAWRIKQINEWFDQYGLEYFSELDIWDIDWEALFENIHRHKRTDLVHHLS